MTFIGKGGFERMVDDKVSSFQGKQVRTNRDIEPVRRGNVVKSIAMFDGPRAFVQDFEGRIFFARDDELILDV